MPYITRKKVKLLHEKPLILKIDLDNDKFSKHYNLDHGLPTTIQATVAVLVDDSNNLKCYINKDYSFKVDRIGHYNVDNKCIYNRWIILPNYLVRDFGIDEGNGLELIVNKINIGGVISTVFSQRMEYGSMDFEPKFANNEILESRDLLITTRFVDEFYITLVREINNAFNIRLFTATVILVRKLFEKLIIDLFREKYGMSRLDLFYDRDHKGFLSLHILIKNLEEKIDDFKPYDFFKTKKEQKIFFSFLRKIKDEGNAAAHSKIFFLDPEKIVDFKPMINKYSSHLDQLIQKVRTIPK